MTSSDMKVLVILISLIFYALVAGNFLDHNKTDLTTSHSPTFYVAELIKDWNRKHKEVNDVVIFNIGENSDVVGNLIKLISDDNSVSYLSPNQCGEFRSRAIAFVIIVSDNFEEKTLYKTFKLCDDYSFWSSSSKFIFIPTRLIFNEDIKSVTHFFFALEQLNVALVYEIEDVTRMLAVDFLRHKIYKVSTTTDVDVVFPDKLQYANENEYKIAKPKSPRCCKVTKLALDLSFMEIISKLKISKFERDFLVKSKRQLEDKYREKMAKEGGNTKGAFHDLENYLKTLDSIDFTTYCALIPIPQRNYSFPYFRPYDLMTWICLVSALVLFAVVWKIFKIRHPGREVSSLGRILVALLAIFYGQSQSFRTNRWYQTMMIQFFVFMMLVLGNVYQSFMISFLTSSGSVQRITTLNEMKNGGYNYEADPNFVKMIETFHASSDFDMDLTEFYEAIENVDYEAKAKNRTVMILTCQKAENVLDTDRLKHTEKLSSDFYYILPEKFSEFYESLKLNPFAEQFDEVSLRIFESGLKLHWESLIAEREHGYSIENEDYLLKMKDLKYVFFMLLKGIFLAILAFFAEILWFKYGKYVRRTKFWRFLKKYGIVRNRRKTRLRFRRTIIEPFEL